MRNILYIGEEFRNSAARVDYLVRKGNNVDEANGLISSIDYLRTREYSTIFFCLGNVNLASDLKLIRQLQPKAKINVLGLKDDLQRSGEEINYVGADSLPVPTTLEQLVAMV